MNKHLGFVCGLFLTVLVSCGQIDWSQLVATTTPAVTETSLPVPTPPLATVEGPSTVLRGMICELTEQAFLIVCVASVCNVRDEVGSNMETQVVYNVPRETLLSAFGVCDCPECVPFSQWYWLGDDVVRGSLWAVADEHIWQRVEE